MEITHAAAGGVTPIEEPGSGASIATSMTSTYPTASQRLADPGIRAARTLRISVSLSRRPSSAAMAGAKPNK